MQQLNFSESYRSFPCSFFTLNIMLLRSQRWQGGTVGEAGTVGAVAV